MRKFLILMSIASGLIACADDTESASAPQGQQVLSQEAAAVAPVIENLGAACTADTDCKGTGVRCITTSQLSGLVYPGGFCTASCKTDAECGGTNGWCPLAATDAAVFPSPEVQKAATVCMIKCTADSECREGYVCSSVSTLSFIPPSETPQTYCRPPVPAK